MRFDERVRTDPELTAAINQLAPAVDPDVLWKVALAAAEVGAVIGVEGAQDVIAFAAKVQETCSPLPQRVDDPWGN